jgi:hypothetical protein
MGGRCTGKGAYDLANGSSRPTLPKVMYKPGRAPLSTLEMRDPKEDFKRVLPMDSLSLAVLTH